MFVCARSLNNTLIWTCTSISSCCHIAVMKNRFILLEMNSFLVCFISNLILTEYFCMFLTHIKSESCEMRSVCWFVATKMLMLAFSDIIFVLIRSFKLAWCVHWAFYVVITAWVTLTKCQGHRGVGKGNNESCVFFIPDKRSDCTIATWVAKIIHKKGTLNLTSPLFIALKMCLE